jgi:hypothetical protein
MGTIVTDGGRRSMAPESYLDEAAECLRNAGCEMCLVVVRPGEYPGLRAAAVEVLKASFLEKDGVEPGSYARHLAEIEPQHFVILLKRGPLGPVPVGAIQVAIHERRPPDSVRDIEAVFGVNIAELCRHTVTPSGRPLPNLAVDFQNVAGIEAIAVWPEYRSSRAPYAHLLYAQTVRYVVRRDIEYLTAILDMRRGGVFTQLQAGLRGPLSRYGLPIRPRVYWTEGQWAHLSNQEVPLDDDGQPVLAVPNCSAPAYIEIPSWLERLRSSADARDRMAHSRILGDGLARYAAFDPSFERDLVPLC